MANIVTADEFIGVIQRSKLVDSDQLKADIKRWKQTGLDLGHPRNIAAQLVREEKLTRWQAEKLLQGKHRGFFLGKYRLLNLLGTGGMSSVYLAEHIVMRRQVAIKVLPQARLVDTSYLERFHQEAQAVALLDHPNIVRAYDVNQEGDIHFFVMEYVAGSSLQERVKQNCGMDFVEAVEYIRQSAKGLEHAHQAGLIHRDIKPANVLVDNRGVVKLLDLGLAQFFRDGDESSLTLKHDERVLGTADYLSPEQALDSHDVDIRTDIYSLGCTFYFLITGHPPFPNGTMAQRLMAHQMKEPAAAEKERQDTPPDLVAILQKMMRKNPDERFQSAQAACDACTHWLEENGGDSWRALMRETTSPDAPSYPSPETPSSVSAASTKLNQSTLTSVEPTPEPTPQPEPTPSDKNSALAEFLAATTAKDPETSKPANPSPPPTRSPKSQASKNHRPKKSPPADSGSIPLIAVPESESDADIAEAKPVDLPSDPPTTDPPTTNPPTTNPPTTNSGKANDPAIPSFVPSPKIRPSPKSPSPKSPSPKSGTKAPDGKGKASDSPIEQPGQLAGLFRAHQKTVIISLVALLVAAIGISVWPTGSQQTGTSLETPADETGAQPLDTMAPKGPVYSGITKSIGPQGDFQTIGDALKFARKQIPDDRRNAHIRFEVAPGQTFSERIVIDNTQSGATRLPRGIHFIVKGGSAILAPSGPEPVISITAGNDRTSEVRFFHIEGFQIDAGGGDVAIRLAGVLPRCEFRKLKVRGFTKAGLIGNAPRAFRNDHILLAETTFQPGSPAAVGIRFERGKDQQDNPAHIKITSCRFFGPLQTGIDFAAPARSIDVTQSIFSQAETGIHFSYKQGEESAIHLDRNSFYKTGDGIRFARLSQIAYGQFTISRNAFIDQTGAAVRVESGYAATDFWQKFSSGSSSLVDNWSSQPLHEGGADIFGRGRKGVAFQFQSTNPNSPQFLVPAEGSGHANIGFSAPD